MPSKQTREHIVAATLMLMITGLFISRALLSISMAVFCVSAWLLFSRQKKGNLSALAFVAGFTLLFLLPFISGLWSHDTAEWFNRVVVKLPLLLLPVAFWFYKPEPNTVFTVTLLFILFVLFGTLYSMYEYVLGTENIESGYLQAKVMPVIPGNDHIRFSWLTVIAVIMILYLQKEIDRPSFRYILLGLMVWLVIFLHILAAKTGLLLLYAATLILLVHYIIQKKKKRLLLLLLLVPLLPFVAYHTLPTFKKRVHYALYDYQHYSQNSYREGLSDGMRIISIKSGLDTWQQNPIAGTGFGDIEADTYNWYRQVYPDAKPYEQILPSSQFLLYACGTGVIGLFFFLAALVMPLTRKVLLGNPFFTAFYIPALVSFIFEIHLESQYGCFIFCFFALWTGLITNRVKFE